MLLAQGRSSIILLGAGASAYCGEVTPHEPPLGDDLYPKLCSAFPKTWGSLPPWTKAAFEKDGSFEEAFLCIRVENDGMTSSLLRDMGIYFLQFELGAHNAYRILAKRARNAILATLNYDCLLDEALLEQSGTLKCTTRDGRPGPVLLKLHGAANLIPDVENISHNIVIGCAQIADVRVDLMRRADALERLGKFGSSGAACMAMYAPGKPVLFSSSVVKDAQEEFANELTTARRVFVVGAKCWPADAHIWGPLAETPAHLTFVNPCREDLDIFTEWASSERGHRAYRTIAAKFAQFVRSL